VRRTGVHLVVSLLHDWQLATLNPLPYQSLRILKVLDVILMIAQIMEKSTTPEA
jgi:hypothetical protein